MYLDWTRLQYTSSKNGVKPISHKLIIHSNSGNFLSYLALTRDVLSILISLLRNFWSFPDFTRLCFFLKFLFFCFFFYDLSFNLFIHIVNLLIQAFSAIQLISSELFSFSFLCSQELRSNFFISASRNNFYFSYLLYFLFFQWFLFSFIINDLVFKVFNILWPWIIRMTSWRLNNCRNSQFSSFSGFLDRFIPYICKAIL